MSKLRKMASGSAALLMAVSWALLARDDPKRYELIVSPAEILAGPKIYLAPTSVLQKYAPCGNQAVDSYLAESQESWQGEIARQIRERFGKKKITAELVEIPPPDFEAKLSSALKLRAVGGFFSPDTGRLDEKLYDSIMTELAKQYGGGLFAPRLIQKKVEVKQLWTHETAPKAKWDGVSRKVEKGGFIGHHEESIEGTMVPVLSLHVDGYGVNGKTFWADGGFDVLLYLKYSPVNLLGGAALGGAAMPGSLGHNQEKDCDAGKLLGPQNDNHKNEAIKLAFEPLFSK